MKTTNTRAYEENDTILRKQILESSNRKCRKEQLFLSFCIENQHEISPIKKYPFIVELEYEIIVKGLIKGEIDLLLTDGKGNFLIVEVKFLPEKGGQKNRVRKIEKRTKVYEQATKNQKLLQVELPNTPIECFALTNELLANNKELANKFKEFRRKKKVIRETRTRTRTLYPSRKIHKIV